MSRIIKTVRTLAASLRAKARASSYLGELDTIHRESRAKIMRKCSEGNSWEAAQESAKHIGIRVSRGSQAKMIFGAGR